MKSNKTKALLLSACLLMQTAPALTVKAESLQVLSAKMSLYGSRGQLIYDIGGETDMSGSIKLESALAEDANAYFAIYDSDKKLVKVDKVAASAGDDEIDFEITSDGEEDRVLNAFIWDENQNPITPKIKLYNVKISALNNYMGDYTAVYGGEADKVEYNWIHSNNDGASWSSMGPETKSFEITDDQHANHTMGLEILADGVLYTADPLEKFPSHWNWTRKDAQPLNGAALTSPEEYVFSVDGVEFVLLDITNKDTAKYMLVSKNTMGDAMLYNPYGTWTQATGSVFGEGDPVNEGYERYTESNFASFFPMYKYLNDETEGTGFKANHIPKSMWDYIDDSVYQTTNTHTWGDGMDIRTNWFGGIALPKVEEVIKYADRIGLSNDGKDWWTNSLIYGTQYDGSAVHYVAGSDENLVYTTQPSAPNMAGRYVRPLFYVSKDFFNNVEIDLETAGAEIKKEIRKACSYDELTKFYSEEVLDLYYGIDGMEIKNVTIDGELEMGAMLTAVTETELVAEDEISYAWYVADTEEGPFKKFSEDIDVLIDESLAGKYIKVKAYLLNGDSAESDVLYVSVFNESFEGTISNLAVRGIFVANNTLTVGYESENGVTDDDIMSYVWYEGASKDGEFTVVSDQPTYKTVNTDDMYYKVSVTLKNGVVYESEPVKVVESEVYYYSNGTNKPQLLAMNPKNNEDYIFTVTEDGKEYNYLLLDTVDTADKARFMVMAVETYGMDYKYTELNTDGFKALLPTVITDNVDYTAWHEQSKDAWGGAKGGLYGIAVPTAKILINYDHIIGVETYNINDPSKANVMFGTHTSSKQTADGGWMIRMGVNGAGAVEVDYSCGAYYHTNDTETRPFFYLDKDFFTEAMIDFADMGSEVINMIEENYTIEELVEAGYTEEEVNVYFGNIEDMTIESVSIYGDIEIDAELQALVSSEYSDYVLCKWMVSDAVDGTYSIAGTGETFVVNMDHNSKYLKLVATLPNGAKAETTPVYVDFLDDEFTGTLTDLKIRGIMSAGNTLSLAYTSDDVTDEDIIVYKWYKAEEADGSYGLAGTEANLATEITTKSRYYKAEIMLVNGDKYETGIVHVAGRNNFAYSNTNHGAELRAMNVDSNYDYLFSVIDGSGDEEKVYDFLLLDVNPESDNARYKVFAMQTYGKSYAIKDLNDEGFKALLPSVITDHIDYTAYHEGTTNMWGVYGQDHYGIGAISVSELLKYKHIIGVGAYDVNDQNLENGFVRFAVGTNAHRSESGSFIVSMRATDDGEVKVYDRNYKCDNHIGDEASQCENCIACDAFSHANDTDVRPFFYLDKDFFNEEDVIWESEIIDSMISDS